MLPRGAQSSVELRSSGRIISQGAGLLKRLPVNAGWPRATWTVACRRAICCASTGDQAHLDVHASSANTNGSSNGSKLSSFSSNIALDDMQQQTQQLQQLPFQHNGSSVQFSSVQERLAGTAALAAAARPASPAGSAQKLSADTAVPSSSVEFMQPVSLLVVELISPSYAIAKMVRIINDDSALTGTTIGAYAAVERNPWTNQYRSPRSASLIGLPADRYTNIEGSVCKPSVQAELLRMIQQQLQLSAEQYNSGQQRIDGVLVFAAPPNTAYSMPVWHLGGLPQQADAAKAFTADLNSRLDSADRIVSSIMQVYNRIEALCANILHPVTKGPVPCSIVMQNDWIDVDAQIGGSYSSSTANHGSSNGNGNSSNNRGSSSNGNGSSSSSSSSRALQQHPPVILGLQNRLFMEPYLAGPVTHGTLHLVKHYWCSDGHLSRAVQPSAMFTNLPGLTGNKCWCGKCNQNPREWPEKDKQLLKERDSRYLIPVPKPQNAAQQDSKDQPKAGQHSPRSVWPEAFITSAVMTFKLHVAKQLWAAAAEDTAAAQLVSTTATAAAEAYKMVKEQLTVKNSKPRVSDKKKKPRNLVPAVKDISDVRVQQGQTVTERQQQLMHRSKTVRGCLWPLLDDYGVTFRKKATKRELVDVVIKHEQQQGLLVAE